MFNLNSNAHGESNHEYLTWDDFSPVWERNFIASVESMRTIPHVTLMCFSFINIHFQDNPKATGDPKSQATCSEFDTLGQRDGNTHNVSTDETDSNANGKHNQHKDGSKWQRSLRLLQSGKRRANRLIRFKRHQNTHDTLTSDTGINNAADEGKRNNKTLLVNPNESVHVALHLFRFNNPLYDYNEMQKKRRSKKINQIILGKDDGPYYVNYRQMLGIDFWCNFCGIDKRQLRQLIPGALWPESRHELARKFIEQRRQQIRDKELSWLQKKSQILTDTRKFFQGRHQPVRCPQRVYSPEEVFRVVPYSRLLNPMSDLKQMTAHKSTKSKLFNLIKRMYILYVYWGEIKQARVVSMEEALQDLLIWMLDEDQAKTRFIALLKDQIKKEIG